MCYIQHRGNWKSGLGGKMKNVYSLYVTLFQIYILTYILYTKLISHDIRFFNFTLC